MEKTAIFKAIFLVLAILFFLGFISLQVFAAEGDTVYQDTGLADGTGGTSPPPSGDFEGDFDFLDSGMPPGGWESFMEDVSAIRRNTDLFLCFVIPCFCAVLAVYKFCMWFYSTFIESVL